MAAMLFVILGMGFAGAHACIQLSKQLKNRAEINVVDANNDPVQNAQTTVRLSSDNSEIINGDTDVNGDAPSGSFTGTTPAGALIKVRKSSPGDTRYENFSTTGTIESGTGLSVTVVLTEDGAL